MQYLVEFHAETKSPVWIIARHTQLLNVFERIIRRAIEHLVDPGNLTAPPAAFVMFQAKQFIWSPVKVICDEGHFLAQLALRIGPQASPTARNPRPLPAISKFIGSATGSVMEAASVFPLIRS
jgi:hypothetical protein